MSCWYPSSAWAPKTGSSSFPSHQSSHQVPITAVDAHAVADFTPFYSSAGLGDNVLDGCKAEVKFGFWAREARASGAGFPSGAWEPVASELVAWGQ
jgi:hypothetical protein